MGFTTFTRFTRKETECIKKEGNRNTFSIISNLVEEQLIEDNKNEEKIKEKEEKSTETITIISQPRFSMFGKTAKIKEINLKCLEQDKKSLKKKRNNNQNQTEKTSKKVKFNPLYLEKVCLFLEEQSPLELKEAHDKQLLNTEFRILCSNWPSKKEIKSYKEKDKKLILNRKNFSISNDNSVIRGELLIKNLSLDQSVLIRYTTDSWATVKDVDGTFFGPYIKNNNYDIYEFNMEIDKNQLYDRGELRGRLEFNVRYTIQNVDYWDNNNYKNYQIKIICDPLNNPWNPNQDFDFNNIDSDEENFDLLDIDDFDEDILLKEKHSQFTNALKEYKHATYHNNFRKCQPWLGTRYDFTQSLYLAKIAPHENHGSPSPSPPSIHLLSLLTNDDLFNLDDQSDYEKEPSLYSAHSSTPTSSTSSPICTSSVIFHPYEIPSSIDFNSTFYTNLLKNYCFYTSDRHL